MTHVKGRSEKIARGLKMKCPQVDIRGGGEVQSVAAKRDSGVGTVSNGGERQCSGTGVFHTNVTKVERCSRQGTTSAHSPIKQFGICCCNRRERRVDNFKPIVGKDGGAKEIKSTRDGALRPRQETRPSHGVGLQKFPFSIVNC